MFDNGAYGRALLSKVLTNSGTVGVDVIAAPVAPTTAFRFGDHSEDPLAMYLEDVFTLPANLGGVPGLTFPVGFDQQGLPVGMQLMGPHFREDILLQSAHIYQQNSDWHRRYPQA